MRPPREAAPSPPGPAFTVRVEHRREQSPRPDAVVEVVARVETGTGGPDRAGGAAGDGPAELPAGDFAVVVAVDLDADRDDTVRSALAATLHALPPGTGFALLGADGRTAYPFDGSLAVAGPDTLQEAAFTAAARRLYVDRTAREPGPGGVGAAGLLAAARERFALAGPPVPPVRHLLLITDGSGGRRAGPVPGPGHEDPLGAEIARCEGEFTCDVLALDGDWDPRALLAVAERLHGTARSVPDRFETTADAALTARRGARYAELPLEVTLRRGVRLLELLETDPGHHVLTARPDPERPRTLRTPAHPWGTEGRTYLLRLGVDATADPLATDLQLAVLAVGGVRTPVVVRWETRARIRRAGSAAAPVRREEATPGAYGLPEESYGADNVTVTVAGAIERMRKELKRGKIVLREGRREAAERHLGAAVQLAHQLGADWALSDVRQLADIVDARLGVVRIHATVDQEELKRSLLLVGNGTATGPRLVDPTSVAGIGCPHCGRPAGSQAVFCIACGRELAGGRR